MALSNDQKLKLRQQLINIEAKKIIESITWADIELGINYLTLEDKERIAKSLSGGGENIRPMIQTKLMEFVKAKAGSVVDEYMSGQTDSQIEYLSRLLW